MQNKELNTCKQDIYYFLHIRLPTTPRLARPVLLDKAKVIIEKYRNPKSEYIFPVFTRKHNTTKKMQGRVRRLSHNVNNTLACICENLGIKESVKWNMARSYFISKMVDEGYQPLQIAE